MVADKPKTTPVATQSAHVRTKCATPSAHLAAGCELRAALRTCSISLLGIGLFSCISNILMLTGSYFMLEVYDRVLPSQSVSTLVALALLAGGLYIAQGVLDLVRSRMLTRIGATVEERVNERVFDVILRMPLTVQTRNDGLQAMRDLDSVRSFMSSMGPTALFDLPWLPFYLIIIAAFHPLLGWAALVGAIILVTLTVLTERMTRAPVKVAGGLSNARHALGEAGRRNAEVLWALGMGTRMQQRWSEMTSEHATTQLRVSDIIGGLGAIAKILRMMLQSGMLALGAYLVIHQEISAGTIIAAGILTSRALAPVELAIGNWKAFLGARQGWKRLETLLAMLPALQQPLQLPAPTKSFKVESATITAPGVAKIIAVDISFALESGQALGIIGPSGSGKSSLARLLVGVWQPVRGKVRLDGAALDQWSSEQRGRHIGYLPQDVELFSGTVAQNISRFDPDADSEAILKAAKTADAHDLIVNLANGYETEICENGAALSAGQRQRVALARALYGDPFLVVLDEPNSNLDFEGEAALTEAILRVKARGGIVAIVAHRPAALGAVDLVLVLQQGRVVAFGPRDEVLSNSRRPARSPVAARSPFSAPERSIAS